MTAWDTVQSRRWVDIGFALFIAANVAGIVVFPSIEAVAFHFVWTSLVLIYGIRMWSLKTTGLIMLGVCFATGGALLWAVESAGAGLDEMAEVPLMAVMFLTVMWHVERRQAAVVEIHRLGDVERRLRERERNLIRDASHQLRTPITVARGHAELLRRDASGQSREDADVILQELDRLSRLADRLLIFAVAEHPDFLERRPIELEPLVVDTVRRWSATARREWRFTVPVEGTLIGDEERLRYALDALLENAVKFTAEADRIAVSSRAEAGAAVIEVSDTGKGIAPDDLPRVFQRLARGDRPHAESALGVGLGLAIVRAIVEAHGGRIEVRSGLGVGTTFSLHLPGFRPHDEGGAGSHGVSAASTAHPS